MSKKRQYIAVWIVLIAAIVVIYSRRERTEYYVNSGVVWATSYNITYEAHDDLGDSIISVTNGIDMSASKYNPRSVLSRINDNTDLATDTIVARLLARSVEINRETGGAFDPTVAPLMRLWKTQADTGALPTDAAIDSVMQVVGIDKVSLTDGKVVKKDPRVQLDFNAIAKGLGCDEVARMLKRNGVENYLVEIGGEIVAHGVNSRGTPWQVSVDLPVEENDTVVHSSAMVVQLDDGAVATSGNYRNYKVVDGQKVAHIINPTTGRSALSNLLSVTVIASNCMDADAYATALMVMGLERSQQFASSRDDLAVILIYADSDGTMQVWRNPAVSRYTP